jgi:hypothetical protein
MLKPGEPLALAHYLGFALSMTTLEVSQDDGLSASIRSLGSRLSCQ